MREVCTTFPPPGSGGSLSGANSAASAASKLEDRHSSTDPASARASTLWDLVVLLWHASGNACQFLLAGLSGRHSGDTCGAGAAALDTALVGPLMKPG